MLYSLRTAEASTQRNFNIGAVAASIKNWFRASNFINLYCAIKSNVYKPLNLYKFVSQLKLLKSYKWIAHLLFRELWDNCYGSGYEHIHFYVCEKSH